MKESLHITVRENLQQDHQGLKKNFKKWKKKKKWNFSSWNNGITPF